MVKKEYLEDPYAKIEEMITEFQSSLIKDINDQIRNFKIVVEATLKSIEKTKRKISTREVNQTDIDFITSNIKTMSYKDMSKELGLTVNQISFTLNDIRTKARKVAFDNSVPEKAYATKEIYVNGRIITSWDYNKPLTEVAKKIEDRIRTNCMRPSKRSNKTITL
jgi:signal recognition particle subunit SEC65